MINYFIVPGLGNSGEEHWQSFLERTEDNFVRIQQEEWEQPDCETWINTIDRYVTGIEDLSSVVLIGHSLGCSTIVHWANRFKRKIKGAVLVAPSDVETEKYATFITTGFNPVPKEKLDFKTIIVASSDDEWVSLERAGYFAECWGSELINIGNAGHINVASGYGEWKEGERIIKSFG